jgi:hypothetical protein
MTTMSSSTSSTSSSSASSSSGVDATGAVLERIGSDAPARDSRPVGADDRAVVAVVSDMDAAQDAVERLIAAGIGRDHVSIVGKDAKSARRVNGFVTTGSIAGQSAAAGAWIGGVFGLLMGTALLFVPGAGPLIVLGPLAAAALGAAEGGLLGGAVAVLLGHFVEDDERQRYEQLVRDGCCLIVVHGDEQEVARAGQLLDEAGTIETRRQDTYRGPGPRIGPIHLVREGMQVVDAAGSEIGKVVLVKMGDPEAITAEHDPEAEPYLPEELAERMLRMGFIKIDRKGLLKPDVYAAADEIDSVDRNLVRLSVPVDRLATEVTST